MSTLTAANALVWCVRCAVTVARGGINAFMCRYFTTHQHMTLLNSAPSVGGSGRHHNVFLDPNDYPPPKWHLDWFSHLCTAQPCTRHTDRNIDIQAVTDHDTCDICSNRLHKMCESDGA